MKIYNEKELNELIASKTTIVDCYADWCGPCKMLAPFLEQIATTYENISFAKLNVDNDEAFARQNNITSIPTLIFYKDGKELDRHIGFASVEMLTEWIDSCLDEK